MYKNNEEVNYMQVLDEQVQFKWIAISLSEREAVSFEEVKGECEEGHILLVLVEKSSFLAAL